MLPPQNNDSTLPRLFLPALSASALVHICFIGLLALGLNRNSTPAVPIFSVEFQPLSKVKAQTSPQIVSPPQTKSEAPIEAKRIFQSEQDSSSIKEQIRRGDEGSAFSPDSQSKTKPQQRSAQPVQQKNTRRQENEETLDKSIEPQKEKAKTKSSALKLRLDRDSLADLSAQENTKTTKQLTEERLQQAIQSASDSNERSSINVGRVGTNDYLPDIPDGEVTLLNTKANKFAVFVRRVAKQVFANLRGAGWQSLRASDIRGIDREGVFEAVLSPKGDLISLTLKSESGSRNFDRVLRGAIERGAKDPNPPAGAEAEDGNVHFIFQAKSWVQIAANNRTGAPVEKRWLVLGTGLD